MKPVLGVLLLLGFVPDAPPGPVVGLDVKTAAVREFVLDERAGSNQVSIFSESTLEDFTVVCNQVAGRCKLDPHALESISGRFSVRVADMHTGIDLRDTHLRSPDWLDAAKYPDVVITIEKAEDVQKTAPNGASLALLGTCTVHGHTNPVRVACKLTYLENVPTAARTGVCDQIRMRAELSLKLADYAIAGPPGSDTVGLKVAKTLDIRATIFASTELADQKPAGGSPEPEKSHKAADSATTANAGKP